MRYEEYMPLHIRLDIFTGAGYPNFTYLHSREVTDCSVFHALKWRVGRKKTKEKKNQCPQFTEHNRAPAAGIQH